MKAVISWNFLGKMKVKGENSSKLKKMVMSAKESSQESEKQQQGSQNQMQSQSQNEENSSQSISPELIYVRGGRHKSSNCNIYKLTYEMPDMENEQIYQSKLFKKLYKKLNN